VLALVFSFVGGGRRRQVFSIVAASLALALVHPTYAFFVAVPLLGFLVARAMLAWDRWRELIRVAATLPAVLLPAGLFALWLKPIVDETVSHRPDADERARAILHYGRQIDVVDGLLRLAPEQISRGGAIAVAGLLAIPIAGLAAPKRWAAYVLGGSLTVLGLLLVPWAFDALTDVVSVSQGRRLAIFIPVPFAIAGAASVLGHFRLAGCLAAFGCGALLQLLYPGEHSYFLVEGGPGWPVWIALGGAAIALVAGAIVRRSVPLGQPIWTAAVALALVAPVGLAGFAYLQQDDVDRFRLSPGLVNALRTQVPARDIVFSDLETSYRIEAYAPVYVSAAPPAHVADTKDNYPQKRRDAVIKFLNSGSLSIPRRFHADWIVVANRRFDLELDLPKAYEDSRFTLYRLSSR
jgi:MFS family permease